MTVRELIEELEQLPYNYEVKISQIKQDNNYDLVDVTVYDVDSDFFVGEVILYYE